MTFVRKDAFGTRCTSTTDRLEWILDNWARAMRSGGTAEGYEHEAAGCVGGGYSSDFDDMVQAADRRLATVTNTVIEDLVPSEQCAIFHHYLNAVFRFGNNICPPELLESAKRNVRRGLERKGVPLEW